MKADEPVVLHEEDRPYESWSEEAAKRVRWRTLLSGGLTPTRGLTLGVAELPAGAPQELIVHRHAQIEAYYILAGEGVVCVSGVEHPVRAGSVVYLPGGAEHGALNTGREPMRLLYVFAADSFDEVEYEFPEQRSTK